MPNQHSNSLQQAEEIKELSLASSPCRQIGEGTDSELELRLESYTNRLLYFDWSALESSEDITVTDPVKKYWTLKELRDLLEARRRLQHLRLVHHKCERRLPSDSSICTAQRAKKDRKCSLDEDAEESPGNNLRQEGTVSATSGLLDWRRDINNGSRNNGYKQASRRTPKSDSMCLAENSDYSTDPVKQGQKNQPLFIKDQDCQSQRLNISGNNMDRMRDTSRISNPGGKDYNVAHYRDLVVHTLDAAYDVIIHSDKGSLCEFSTNGNPDSTRPSITGENEGISRVACGAPNEARLLSPVLSEDTQYRLTLQRDVYNMEQQLRGETFFRGSFQQPWAASVQEMKYYASHFPSWEIEQSSQKAPKALGLEGDILGNLKGFWRQNKLY
ncbi:uncharacterized protein ATNIH1004_007383 [Aspergillus tanneri]|uniref:Uncharacterized protein n=1 Tax=Aspergillus tanneri TaxID=1220188 RepID=A0A5M9MG74_9EURO|nr:uncharacterized protein ATNIH1004_007383 [Aspergillus tanneri]KAA8645962.1 hypothetical protein ATNIH1004_007383 [Aspergillus tanneri]